MNPTYFTVLFTTVLAALFVTFLGLTRRMLLRGPGQDADSDPSARRLLRWFAGLLVAIAGVTLGFVVSWIGVGACARLAFYVAAFGGWLVFFVGAAFFARGLNQLTSGELAQVRLLKDVYSSVLRPAWRSGQVPWGLDAVALSAIIAMLLGQFSGMEIPAFAAATVGIWLALMAALIWLGILAVVAGIVWTMLAEGSWPPGMGTDVAPDDPQYVWRLALRRGFYPASGAGTSKVLPFPIAELRERWRTGKWRIEPHWQRGLILGFGLLAILCGTLGFWLARPLPRSTVMIVVVFYVIVRIWRANVSLRGQAARGL